jgi:hypothetical protein
VQTDTGSFFRAGGHAKLIEAKRVSGKGREKASSRATAVLLSQPVEAGRVWIKGLVRRLPERVRRWFETRPGETEGRQMTAAQQQGRSDDPIGQRDSLTLMPWMSQRATPFRAGSALSILRTAFIFRPLLCHLR